MDIEIWRLSSVGGGICRIWVDLGRFDGGPENSANNGQGRGCTFEATGLQRHSFPNHHANQLICLPLDLSCTELLEAPFVGLRGGHEEW